MQFQFDPSLPFQKDAIDAVVNVFQGQLPQSSVLDSSSGELFLNKGNRITLTEEELLANVQNIQERNYIEKVRTLRGREFSIEMETGTGKTYIYLRTIFELHKQYGFLKFIIVVPSIAVREGVLKSIEVMKAHFQTLYDKVPFEYFVYDSKRLSEVCQFAMGDQIQIMIINIQAFVKDIPEKHEREMTAEELKTRNVIHRENDSMLGQKPIELIQATQPLVLIDEPQSVDTTEKSQKAIKQLHPAATFRYSATHRNSYNLLYKLDPIQAYDMGLVKRIEVASIRPENHFNEAYVKLLKIDNKNGIKAQVEIHQQKADGAKPCRLWVKTGDDLFVKSGQREAYKEGFIVQNIDCTKNREGLRFSSGSWLSLGKAHGDLGEDVMKAQVAETIEQHLKKEEMLQDQAIKVLSLFFIDKVAHYRTYHPDGSTSLGKIGQWFEETFCKLKTKPEYKDLIPFDVSKVHNGYFSQDKQHQAKDTQGNSKYDETTWNLTRRDKEKLRDPKEPLRFIFTHSALREGWDNPNVFQICTLNKTRSLERKRQEIGRGMRLPVNHQGERVHDKNLNYVTVIANESYEEFARTLQTELEKDCGIHFGRVKQIAFAHILRTMPDGQEQELGQEASSKIWQELQKNGFLDAAGKVLDKFDPENPHFDLKLSKEFAELRNAIMDEINKKLFKHRIVNARKRHTLQFKKQVFLSEEFASLWQHIQQRTRYRVNFKTHKLIEKISERIQELPKVPPVRLLMARVQLQITGSGVDTNTTVEDKFLNATQNKRLPDIVTILQQKTGLTRRTLVQVLKKSGRLDEFKTNPHAFMEAIAKEIYHVLHDLMVAGIRYEKIEGEHWDMARIEQESEKGMVRYLNNLYEVQYREKALFDHIECESEGEKAFARDLDHHERVKLFLKLPSWFKIDTPVGAYNPDWAFVTQRDEKLYFVRETKSTTDSQKLRVEENQKIACGKQHFASLDVNYDVVTNLNEVTF